MGVKPCEMWMLGYVAHWHETDSRLDLNDIRQWLYDETDHHPEDIDDFVSGTAYQYLERKEEEAREVLRRSKQTKLKIGTANEWIGKDMKYAQFRVREMLGRNVELTSMSVDSDCTVWVRWIEPREASDVQC